MPKKEIGLAPIFPANFVRSEEIIFVFSMEFIANLNSKLILCLFVTFYKIYEKQSFLYFVIVSFIPTMKQFQNYLCPGT